MNKNCDCNICKNIEKRMWKIIEECKCFCHTSNKINGHDNLCCEYPNGKKIDNPYKKINYENRR